MKFSFKDLEKMLNISCKVTTIYKYTSSFYCNRVSHTITPTKLSNEICLKLVQFFQQQRGMHELKQVISGYLS